ncbi:unnamed protein product [Arabidopsis lyrata]|nr:unnamed protein product [Arabidopsis lyrata]
MNIGAGVASSTLAYTLGKYACRGRYQVCGQRLQGEASKG